jgi:hypothetical protein
MWSVLVIVIIFVIVLFVLDVLSKSLAMQNRNPILFPLIGRDPNLFKSAQWSQDRTCHRFYKLSKREKTVKDTRGAHLLSNMNKYVPAAPKSLF